MRLSTRSKAFYQYWVKVFFLALWVLASTPFLILVAPITLIVCMFWHMYSFDLKKFEKKPYQMAGWDPWFYPGDE